MQTPALKQHGFILLYTLWILAACSVVLGVLTTSSNSTKSSTEKLMAGIEFREAISMADYVIQHSYQHERGIDTRFLLHKKVVISERTQANKEILDELTGILSQLGMKLNITPSKEKEAPTTTKAETVEESVAQVTTETSIESRLFGITNDKPLIISPGSIEYKILVQPANVLPNLNRLSREATERYLAFLGMSEKGAHQLAGRVKDWVDANDYLSSDGAESADYPLNFGPRNNLFQSWDELFYLKGSNAMLVDFLRKNFVIHGGGSKIYPSLLQPEAIAALTGLSLLDIQIVFENDKLPSNEKVSLQEILTGEDARIYRNFISKKEDQRVLLIDIVGSRLTIKTIFDTEDKLLLDWYFEYNKTGAAAVTQYPSGGNSVGS